MNALDLITIACSAAIPGDVMRKFERRARLRRHVERAEFNVRLAIFSSARRCTLSNAIAWSAAWEALAAKEGI